MGAAKYPRGIRASGNQARHTLGELGAGSGRVGPS